MNRVIELTKDEALERFAKSIPNADKMLVDWSLDTLTVQFKGKHGVHAINYNVSSILNKAIENAKKQGIQIVYK